MRMGGGGAGERCSLDFEHKGRHTGSMWAAVHVRQVPLRPQVCRHAGGATGGSVGTVE